MKVALQVAPPIGGAVTQQRVKPLQGPTLKPVGGFLKGRDGRARTKCVMA